MNAVLARHRCTQEALRAGLVVLTAWVLQPAQAQTAPSPAASSPATRSQQVEREAVNPLRRILEASRIQRTNPPARKEAEAPARPVVREARPARESRDAAAAAPNPSPVAVEAAAPASAPTASEPPQVPVAVPAAPPAAPPADPPAGPPSRGPAVDPVATAAPPPAASGVASGAASAVPAEVPAAAGSVPPGHAQAPAAPLRRIDTAPLNLPDNLVDRLPAMAELPVSLVVLTDGTVGEVELPPGLEREVARALRTELRRWRFEPPTQPTTLQLRLVLPRPGS